MDIKEVLKYCLLQKGSYEDYPFGPEPLVMKICNKMYALISMSSGKGTLSLKCDPFLAQSFRQKYASVTPGYHLNKQHWNSIILDDTILDEDLKWMIDHSYGLVFKSLTKKEKVALAK